MGPSLIFVLVCFVAFLFVVGLFFFVFRELILWYWRVNEAVDALKSIQADIRELRIQREDAAKQNLRVPPPPDMETFTN